MKSLLISIIVTVFLASSAMAQIEVEENSSFLDRIYTGGGLALSFGNNVTVVGASPMLGYMITDRWSAGLGVTYLYRKFGDVNSNIYGGRIFTQYTVFNPFFVYTEYEALSYDFTLFDGVNNREIIPAFNVGGGIIQPLGRVASFQFVVLYDLLYDNLKSPQPNALSVRGGIAVGF